ncbi:MAG: sigma-70 family RNA polymerase sigma factor [Oscillospiraceae bacterium]|nr:sigma-70 family RNA polymerase sigma factor [Oscillospiraceae bacterium]
MTVAEKIIQEYYKPILLYCLRLLHGDLSAAEDCTQEVFLVFYQKVNSLDMTKEIAPWLYRTADRIVRAYIRKHPIMVDIDSIPEIAEPETVSESCLDVLTAEERALVEAYYDHSDKTQFARAQGIRHPDLCRRPRCRNLHRDF